MKHLLFCRFLLLIVYLYVCATSLLCAQTTRIDTGKVYRIEEVTITVKRRIMKEVIPVQTLSGLELERLSEHSVADAIRYFSGAQIKDFGGIGGLKTVNIRSMGTNHVGVFYDGIELGNAQNGQIDLGRYSLDNMEAISLYNGQKSSIFQSAKDYGSAGSIYLETKKPTFDSEQNYHLKAAFKTGSFGVVNPSLLWKQKLNEHVNSSFSTEYLYTTGKYDFTYSTQGGYDTTAVRKNGDVNALRVEYGLFGKVKQGTWTAKAYLYNSERGLPGAMVRGRLEHQDRQWDTSFFTQGSFQKNFGKYSLLLNGKYAYDYLHYKADPNDILPDMENRYKQQEVYLSTANQYTILPCWEVSLSADFQYNKLNADLQDFSFPRRYTTLAAAATSLNFNRFKLQASLLGTFVQDKVNAPSTSMNNKSRFTPAITASYRPFGQEDFNLRAFYKKIFRMPTLNDLYYTFIGNSWLKPEYTTQYNVGATYTKQLEHSWLKRIEAQVDAYYIEVENKIVAMPTSNQFRWTMLNLGQVEIRGIDVALQGEWAWGKNWHFGSRINYTYQKAQDFTPPNKTPETNEENYYGDQIPYIPWHSGSVVLNGSYKSWDVNYSFIYIGDRYNQNANIPENFVQAWYTSDLSAGKTFRWGGKTAKATVAVNNLFNQQYEVVQSYPMPGTNFKITINITI